jgi:hypothetical protein
MLEAPVSKGFAPQRGGGRNSDAMWHSDGGPDATKFSTAVRKFTLILAPNFAGGKIEASQVAGQFQIQPEFLFNRWAKGNCPAYCFLKFKFLRVAQPFLFHKQWLRNLAGQRCERS